jgi:hypothetical protein
MSTPSRGHVRPQPPMIAAYMAARNHVAREAIGQMAASSALVRSVTDALGAVDVSESDRKRVLELAIRISLQGLEGEMTFVPGTKVRNRFSPFETAIALISKPSGFEEPGWYDPRGWKQTLGHRRSDEMVWTVDATPGIRNAVISQSPASDWEISI